MSAEPKVRIGCRYNGDFGWQLRALRALPRDGRRLVAPRDPSFFERLAARVARRLEAKNDK